MRSASSRDMGTSDSSESNAGAFCVRGMDPSSHRESILCGGVSIVSGSRDSVLAECTGLVLWESFTQLYVMVKGRL